MTKWYYNSKTGEIDSYDSDCAGYELKGVLYAYGDALTIGFHSKDEAIEWAKEWGYCSTCDAASAGKVGEAGKDRKCFRCGTKIEFVEVKIV